MTLLEVFTPRRCPAVYLAQEEDPEEARLAADVEWLKAHGVSTVLFPLPEQPGRFVEHDVVRFLMNLRGPEALPVILVDGVLRSHRRYPTREQLAAWTGVDLGLTGATADAQVPAAAERDPWDASDLDVSALDRAASHGSAHPAAGLDPENVLSVAARARRVEVPRDVATLTRT